MPRLFKSLRNAFDFGRTARVILNFDNGSLKHDTICSYLKLLRLIGQKAFNDRFDFAANDTFVRTGEAGIA
jgi:hypothetical protein